MHLTFYRRIRIQEKDLLIEGHPSGQMNRCVFQQMEVKPNLLYQPSVRLEEIPPKTQVEAKIQVLAKRTLSIMMERLLSKEIIPQWEITAGSLFKTKKSLMKELLYLVELLNSKEKESVLSRKEQISLSRLKRKSNRSN